MNEVPPTYKPIEEWVRQAATAVNLLIKGNANNAGSATLTPAATSTTVTDPRATRNSIPLLAPLDSNAAAAAPYVSSRSEGSFVITHGVPGGTATVSYVLHGGQS